MKIKSMIVISVIVAIILLVVLLPVKPSDVTPEMSDNVEIKEETTVELGVDVTESPDFNDEVNLDSEAEFYIDENGVKHYVIEVEDSPILGE